MDVNDKIRELRADINKMSAEEQEIKARIADLKKLVEEKAKRAEVIAKLREEEEVLIRELGL